MYCTGHGNEVRTVAWHPSKALIASGSKDAQMPMKLWDPKSGKNLCTLHHHQPHIGNWLLSASRDGLVKIFDVRAMKELQTFRGHKLTQRGEGVLGNADF